MMFDRLVVWAKSVRDRISGSTSFTPRSGMSYADFERMAGLTFKGVTKLVKKDGTTTVYVLSRDLHTFYWFESDRLMRITQTDADQT